MEIVLNQSVNHLKIVQKKRNATAGLSERSNIQRPKQGQYLQQRGPTAEHVARGCRSRVPRQEGTARGVMSAAMSPPQGLPLSSSVNPPRVCSIHALIGFNHNSPTPSRFA